MSKKKKKSLARRREKEVTPQQQLKRQLKAMNWRLLGVLALNTLILFVLYYTLVEMDYFVYVFPVYGAALLILICAYLIYNRGLVPQSLTKEQLPADWDERKKDEFLADAARRIRRSKWMLTIIFPLCLVFAFEIINVLLLDVWRNA